MINKNDLFSKEKLEKKEKRHIKSSPLENTTFQEKKKCIYGSDF